MPHSLQAIGVSVAFGGIVALADVSLDLPGGEILGLIGPNGAGKTTLVNVLSGFQRPTSGDVQVDGAPATRWQAHRFPAAGVVRTFQAVRPFRGLTVAENVEAGCIGRGLSRTAARLEAVAILRTLHLADKAAWRADALNFGDEHRLGLARALALQPRFLLLDEPGAGLNAGEIAELRDTIRSIRDRLGCGVLVIDHNMTLIMGVCERVQVLATGRTLASGTPDAVLADAAVRRAYLGAAAA